MQFCFWAVSVPRPETRLYNTTLGSNFVKQWRVETGDSQPNYSVQPWLLWFQVAAPTKPAKTINVITGSSGPVEKHQLPRLSCQEPLVLGEWGFSNKVAVWPVSHGPGYNVGIFTVQQRHPIELGLVSSTIAGWESLISLRNARFFNNAGKFSILFSLRLRQSPEGGISTRSPWLSPNHSDYSGVLRWDLRRVVEASTASLEAKGPPHQQPGPRKLPGDYSHLRQDPLYVSNPILYRIHVDSTSPRSQVDLEHPPPQISIAH